MNVGKKKPPRKDNPYVKTRLEDIYYAMTYRCHNPNCSIYYKYGAKGISVCKEWREDKFKFFEWSITHGYKDDLTIDRIDNSKGYSPDNCRWATVKQQSNNRTDNHYITLKGERHTLNEWSEIVGLSCGAISQRLKRGWTEEKAIFTPQMRYRKKKG